MSDIPVIDPTMTPAWDTLDQLADNFEPDLRKLFADDPNRTQTFTFDAADLHVDLSKNLVCPTLVGHLLALAEQTGVLELRDRMFAGEHINVTEDRAVLHTALRRPATDSLTVDGQDAIADVHEVLEKVYAFARRVRSGEWVGITGKPVKTVVNVGIGGSDLGPVMAYEALKPYVQKGLECRFISNIDPTDAGETTKDLDPETTLVIVASKTFTTLETITNAKVVRAWLLDGLRERGNRLVQGGRVVGVVAADQLGECGRVGDRAGDGADLVQGRGHSHQAVTRHRAVGGLRADRAGHERGLAD